MAKLFVFNQFDINRAITETYDMGTYNNETEAIIDLQERGYDQDFILKDEQLLYVQESEIIRPDEFEITETYRFMSKQGVHSYYIIYAVRAINKDIRGILMASPKDVTARLLGLE